MSGVARAVLAGVLFLVAAIAMAVPDEMASIDAPPPGVHAASTPKVSTAQINRQDHVPAALADRQRRDGGNRPLIALLPLHLGGVRIDVTGLLPDGRTVVSIVPGPRGRAFADRTYRRTLSALGDSGRHYAVRWSA